MNVLEGTTAPWFGMEGGGTQFHFDRPIKDLWEAGILEDITSKPEEYR